MVSFCNNAKKGADVLNERTVGIDDRREIVGPRYSRTEQQSKNPEGNPHEGETRN